MRTFVLIDFDGVIADSFDAAFITAKTYCALETEERYRSMFNGNAHDFGADISNGDHSHCNHGMDWWETFVPLFEQTAKPFNGIEFVLRELSHVYTLIIVSSSVASPIQGFLQKHGLERYITEIMATEVHKKKTEKIRLVFDRYSTSPDQCVFVTDTCGDMREAATMGVASIACTWGFQHRVHLEKGNAFRIVDTPHEILQAVDDYFLTKKTTLSP